jgi:hypothetical protein
MCDKERQIMSPLQYASTKEVISELFSRRTFTGVLVYSMIENKFEDQNHEFAIQTTIDSESSVQLLSMASDIMKFQNKEGS